MTDRTTLVQRLRDMPGTGDDPNAPDEAADEIDRLQRELAEAREGIREVMDDHATTLERLDEARRDAERYRFQRDELFQYFVPNKTWVLYYPGGKVQATGSAETYEAAIGAAILAAKGDGQ